MMPSYTPPPEQIASMKARGWEWSELLDGYQVPGPGITLQVLRVSGGWRPRYDWEIERARETPEEAADVAEAWLRRRLAPLRFPWLKVEPAVP